MYNELKIFNDVTKQLFNRDNGKKYENPVLGKSGQVVSPHTWGLYRIISPTLRDMLKGLSCATFDNSKILDENKHISDYTDKVKLDFDSLTVDNNGNTLIVFKSTADENIKVYINEKLVKPYFGKTYLQDFTFYGNLENTSKTPVYIVNYDVVFACILPINMK